MKYIKLYEEMDDESEINKTLKEICLELKDDGYFIIFNQLEDMGENIFAITIGKLVNGVHKLLEFSDIKEYLLRIKEYLGINYILFMYDGGLASLKVTKLNEDTDIDRLYTGEIVYKNE